MAKHSCTRQFNPLKLKIRLPFSDSESAIFSSVWDTARMKRMSIRRREKTILGTRKAPPAYLSLAEFECALMDPGFC